MRAPRSSACAGFQVPGVAQHLAVVVLDNLVGVGVPVLSELATGARGFRRAVATRHR